LERGKLGLEQKLSQLVKQHQQPSPEKDYAKVER
jgi:hypothetical protein